ncbi:MAG: SirB2 family protein [Lysobacterales bacterium]
MLSLYLPIKAIHIAAVATSGALFALRGTGVLAGGRWPNARPLRMLSYGIDTVLLGAAVLLLLTLRLNPFLVPWLGVKLLLLVVYVVLGSYALRRARSRGQRLGFFLAALACFGLMFSIARAHHPLGILRGLGLL